MSQEMPKDLGIKIGTEKEALWTKVKKEAEQVLKQTKDIIIIQTAIVALAARKIAEEKRKV